MKKELMDDNEDKLKRRARRRLIGAVTLTLAIVILLPLLLDSEPKPGGQNIELLIPDKDKVSEFAPNMALPSMPLAGPASAITGVSAPDAAPVAASDAVDASAASAPSPAPAKVLPEVKSAPEVKSTPEKSTPEKSTPEIKNPPVPQPAFVVQIGAFSNADSALQLQMKLKKQGIKTYTEKVDNKTRVRAGPFATREAADKVRHKLEAQGLKPVVSPAP